MNDIDRSQKRENVIIFLGNARDFHAIDWYRMIKKICLNRQVLFATDLIESEGHTKLVDEDDHIHHLVNIDKLLLNRQTSFGNIWRNVIKLLFFPLQVLKIKILAKQYPDAIFHAHTMYYLFIGWLANINYIGSPQGDEILIRPFQSKLYHFFSIKALLAADHIIVDSMNLKNGIKQLCGKDADVIQYGIDVASIQQIVSNKVERELIVSIRALYPLYRIEEILDGRNQSKLKSPMVMFYPFWEQHYKEIILAKLKPTDTHLGRLPSKNDIYEVLSKSKMAISIPMSDSSPRSVYESIFCGCCVVVTYNPWIESVAPCMRERIFVVDLHDQDWFDKALDYSNEMVKKPYVPSKQALELFDQECSMRVVAKKYYNFQE